MIKHIVTFRLKGSSIEKSEVALRFKEALEALPEIIEPLKSIEVGINVNPNEKWDIVLTALLPTLDDVNIYANHPAHVAAASIIAPFKEDRACVDYITTE